MAISALISISPLYVAAAIPLFIITYLVYQSKKAHIDHIPGPFLAKYTNAWRAIQAWKFNHTIGPFLAAAFVQHSTWRGLFWFISPLTLLSGAVTMFLVPSKRPHDSLMSKVRKIDYLGSLFSTAGIILLLIPISGGGTYFDWKSPMVIIMLNLGGICMILFLLVEWKWAQLPTMPRTSQFVSDNSTSLLI